MSTKLTVEKINEASRVLKCMAHPERMRLVECLEFRTLSVGDLVKKTALSQAVVSKHLGLLRSAGIVRCQVKRNFRYYSILNQKVLRVLDCVRSQKI